MVTESKTITVTEAAEMLGISRTYAYQLHYDGKLPGARRIGNRIVVQRKAIEDFIEGKTE